jgi:hypothetical protein
VWDDEEHTTRSSLFHSMHVRAAWTAHLSLATDPIGMVGDHVEAPAYGDQHGMRQQASICALLSGQAALQ